MGGRENETGRSEYLCALVFVCDCRESITVTEQAERTLKKKLSIRENNSLKEELWNFLYQYLIKYHQHIIRHVSTVGLPGKYCKEEFYWSISAHVVLLMITSLLYGRTPGDNVQQVRP